jgi:Fic family protein
METQDLERYIQRLVDEKFKRRRKPRITKSRRKLTLADLEAMDTGPEMTAYDIERISGISDETVRREIQLGVIAARIEKRGTMTVQWVAFSEARRYLVARGKL